MINYSTLAHNLKRGILNFSTKISKTLSRPDFKFVSQMIYGILNSQSCHLSKISRTLNEKATLKKVIDRISRNLSSFEGYNIILENYITSIKSEIKENGILIIDGSDITKPCSTKMESLSRVRDGSTGEYGMGYHTLGVTALTAEKKMPLPVYSKIYSSSEAEFISEDDEVLKCLRFLGTHFKKSSIRAFDRGYDNNRYYEHLIKNNEKFIIRAKKNRDVIYKDEKINILALAKKFKGKYRMNFKTKNGMNVECKISIVPIRLTCRPNDELNLVVCYGFGKIPMMLITNLKSDDKRLSVAVTKVYLMRWRIEEFYRFKKQQFKFEDLRVRSLKSIRNLDLFLTVAIGYLATMSEKHKDRMTAMQVIEVSKRIQGTPKFVFYALADGLFAIFAKCKQGISKFLEKVPKTIQLCLFKDECFGIA